jgi:Asp-tRNA(Asn)/Glu-tRNA(Gln) amidotransferase C subunit
MSLEQLENEYNDAIKMYQVNLNQFDNADTELNDVVTYNLEASRIRVGVCKKALEAEMRRLSNVPNSEEQFVKSLCQYFSTKIKQRQI